MPDLNEGGSVDYEDVLKWTRLVKSDTYRGDLGRINDWADAIIAGHSSAVIRSLAAMAATSSRGNISSDRLASGVWDNSGASDYRHTGNVHYPIEVSNSQTITIDLTSSVDTYLFLLNADDTVVAENDDFNDTDAQIEGAVSAGNYVVVAATYYSGESADFSLTLNGATFIRGAAAHASSGVVSFGVRSVSNSWSNSGGRNASSSNNSHLEIEVQYAGEVTIDLMSSVDTYLYLIDVTGNVIAENDDFSGDRCRR